MKKILMCCAAVFMLALGGCGIVDQGQVGVRTAFGKIEQQVVTGFYTSPMSSVTEYTTKETTVNLTGLTPQAADKMTVQDFEATIFYKANGQSLPSFQGSFAGQSAKMESESFLRPGYIMVQGMANSAVMGEVAKYNADQLNTNREGLEKGIKADLQAKLTAKAPGVFEVTGVVVRKIVNDQTVQQTIRDSVSASNRLETATKLVKVKEQEALANDKLAASFTPAFLQHEYNEALKACADNPKCTLIVDGSSSGKVLNLGKGQ